MTNLDSWTNNKYTDIASCEHDENFTEVQIDQWAGEIEVCTACGTILTPLGFLSSPDDFYQQKVDDARTEGY